MTVNDVKHYRFLDKAIRSAEKRIDVLREDDLLCDRVQASYDKFPFTASHARISGHQNTEKIRSAKAEIERLVMLKQQIECVCESLTDPMDKVIFERTMQGQSQKQIALHLKVNQGTISRRLAKLCEYFA